MELEGSPMGSDEPGEFRLLELDLKGRKSSKPNNRSRRYSGSYITTWREESNRSFRSNITNVCRTASSPGCHLRHEIDQSTYSFNTALRALQARPGCIWECLSPDGFALNSKWNEAERYICNPVSGQVPVECLSSNTLNKRPFHNLAYSSRRFGNCPKPPVAAKDKAEEANTKEEVVGRFRTRDVEEDNCPPIQEKLAIPKSNSMEKVTFSTLILIADGSLEQ